MLECSDIVCGKLDFVVSCYIIYIVGSEFGLDLVFDSI